MTPTDLLELILTENIDITHLSDEECLLSREGTCGYYIKCKTIQNLEETVLQLLLEPKK